MKAIFADGRVEDITIDFNNHLGRGATAAVYPVKIQNGLDYACKLYHDCNSIDFKRLHYLIKNNPLSSISNQDGFDFTWPVAMVSKSSSISDSVGYLMMKIDLNESYPVSSAFISPLRQSHNEPHWPLNIRCTIGQKICAALALIHSKGFVISDFKPENMRIKKNGEVIFLDCDSFGFSNQDVTFSPTHFSAGYIAPELLNAGIGPDKADIQQDLFALAVILFKLLNYGIHPFQGVLQRGIDCDSDDDKVRAGFYAYGIVSSQYIKPSPTSVHNCWPNNIRNAFDNSFLSTNRTSSEAWKGIFAELLINMAFARCDEKPQSLDHIKFYGFKCSVCQLENFKLSVKRNQSNKPSYNINSSSRTPSTTSSNGQAYTPQHTPPISPKKESSADSLLIFWLLVPISLFIFFSYLSGDSKKSNNQTVQNNTSTESCNYTFINDSNRQICDWYHNSNFPNCKSELASVLEIRGVQVTPYSQCGNKTGKSDAEDAISKLSKKYVTGVGFKFTDMRSKDDEHQFMAAIEGITDSWNESVSKGKYLYEDDLLVFQNFKYPLIKGFAWYGGHQDTCSSNLTDVVKVCYREADNSIKCKDFGSKKYKSMCLTSITF